LEGGAKNFKRLKKFFVRFGRNFAPSQTRKKIPEFPDETAIFENSGGQKNWYYQIFACGGAFFLKSGRREWQKVVLLRRFLQKPFE